MATRDVRVNAALMTTSTDTQTLSTSTPRGRRRRTVGAVAMTRTRGLRRLAVGLFAACASLAAAPITGAAAVAPRYDPGLAALWTAVFQTPSAENSFGTGGAAFACWDLGDRTVSPFAPSGVESCTVRPGTRVFVVASSVECSTFEGDGTTEAELRACAEQSDAASAPSVTVDGRPIPVSGVETPVLNLVLPADNIIGAPAGTTGQSVAHGWVAHLHPLSPGTHTVVGSGIFSTRIVVSRNNR